MGNRVMDGQSFHAIRTVTRNSFFLFVSRVLGMCINLVTISLVARYLGVEFFGYYALVMAICVAVTPLSDFGFGRIICREISKNKADADLYLNTTVIIRFIFSFVLFSIGLVLLKGFSTWNKDINTAIIVALFTELVLSMCSTYLSVARAFEKMQFDLFTNMVHKFTSLVLILVVVSFDLGFLGIFYARLLGSVVYILFSIGLLHIMLVKPSKRFNLSLAKHIIKESFPLAIFGVFLALIFKVDIFFLDWLGDKLDIALFESSHRLIVHMQVFAMAFSTSVFPLLSRSAKEDSDRSLKLYYGMAYKLLLIMGAAASASLFLGGEPLIIVIFGETFREASVSLRILSPTMAFLFLTQLQSFLLTATGRQFLNTVSIAVSLAINIILDIVLIPSYGYIGASIGTLVAYFSLLVINSYFVVRQGIRLNFAFFVFKVILASGCMSLVAFLSTDNDLVTLLLRLGVGLLIYVFAAGLFRTLSYNEVEAIKRILFKNYKK